MSTGTSRERHARATSTRDQSGNLGGRGGEPVDLSDPKRFLNRETSWLDFNDRVLSLAEFPDLPLLERVRFLSIACRNLDEFFQVRVAVLNARYEARLPALSPDGLGAEEQLDLVRERVLRQMATTERIGGKGLLAELAGEGVEILEWGELRKRERREASQIFKEQVFPVVTPLAVDPAHPFPYVSNLSFNLAVSVRHPSVRSVRFARLKVPPLFPRFVPLGDEARFLPIESLIAEHLEALFPGMEIVSHSFFRVTRDADLALEEADSDDLMEAVESGLHRRHRASDAVRLEVHDDLPVEMLDLLTRELQLDPEDVYRCRGLLALGDLDQLCRLERPALSFPVHTPRVPEALREDPDREDVFAALRKREILVHHPYDSFSQSVEALLSQAATDPRVLAIKLTIYRTTQGVENPIAGMLMKAAQAGKQVVALVELKARFDEQTNIEWARRLEEAGVHVVYGIVGLKTHAKIALVVRQEEHGIRRYCHIGTGNYNPFTARLYEDLGLLSASEELGADLADLFNHLTGFSRQPEYRRLLVAPEGLRESLVRLIEEESAAPDGSIVVKCNNLSDPDMIDALYAASQAGVDVELIVRGICCLRPGLAGFSERIRVRSVLGRFLEHSRIFRFGSKARGYRYFFGSADWMTRNLDSRVEAVVPIDDPDHQGRLERILDTLIADDTLAWQLAPDGTWSRVPTQIGLGAQTALAKLPA